MASSLGAVEIILAVHRPIDSPKISSSSMRVINPMRICSLRVDAMNSLTLRRATKAFQVFRNRTPIRMMSTLPGQCIRLAFDRLRGLRGARDLRGRSRRSLRSSADASLAGGMAFEALNDIGQEQTPLVIILNDNEMAISRNVGAMALHLGSIRVNSNYRKSRDTIQEHLESFGTAGKALVKVGKTAQRVSEESGHFRSMLFEQLGIICTPPIDGHNIPAIKAAIKNAFAANAPVLVHVITKKGKGYAPAEQNPSRFHGCGPYDLELPEIKRR